MDPNELLGRGGAYMLDVLTWDGGDEGPLTAERSSSTPRIDEHVIDPWPAGEAGQGHRNLRGPA